VADDRGEVYRRIAQGSAAMPGFARKLDRAAIERLTDFSIDLARE
jgi:hypothetical protein